jgi:hypothetical protein
MVPGLGTKYDIRIETISKPKAEYMTDDCFELDLPVAPAARKTFRYHMKS